MTSPQITKKSHFSKRFLWGAATAAHQVDGGLHNQWTVWELENARSLAAKAPYQFEDLDNWPQIKRQAMTPSSYVSGRAVDHYHRYEEDFQILQDLGLNTFRFGIEWARVEPEEGNWDTSEIDHYRKYLKSLKKAGITPVATLFHFTLPVWFAEMGGFEKRRNVKYFVRFATKIIDELGSELSWIITVNEPTVYVGESYMIGEWPPNKTGKLLGVEVLRNLIYAHKQIYKITKNDPKLKISMAHHVTTFYAGDDAWLSRASARVASYVGNDFTIKRVAKYSDFLAVNYYFSHRIYGYREHNPYETVNDLGWDMQPAMLEEVLVDLDERYDLPIMITENGLADADDSRRKWWIRESLEAMNRALGKSVKLIGYLHWSLLDNFEWDKGFWPQFGLVAVDRRTMKRTVRSSARWYGSVVKKLSK